MTEGDRARRIVVGLLGVVAVRRDGVLHPVAGGRARTVLAALAVEPGRYVSAQTLVDDVWGGEPPRSPANALQTQVSRLRALLPDGAIEAGPAGYRLVLARDEVDIAHAHDLLRAARTAEGRADHREALRLVGAARDLWRGEAGTDLSGAAPAEQVRAAAAALRSGLDGIEIEALLGDSRYADALPGLLDRCDRDPLDEHAHADLMRCLIRTGRANEALEVFARIRAALADRLGTDPSTELVELNAATLRGEAAGPAESPPPTAIGLRAAPNPLLGRDVDTAALLDCLQTSRVVTILGPGGTGKTRMAHALGADTAKRMPVALVELAAVRSDEDVIGAITGTLGVGEVQMSADGLLRTRVRDVRQLLREALSARPSLLILDNCEHVIDVCAEVVADLVACSAGLTVLTTSRTPLMISSESVYPLPTLEVDEAGSPATRLFRDRALAVRPAARLDAAVVGRLCRALDGLPLAIELAAARVRTMSPEQIEQRLADRFALLRDADRSSPSRHRTLHAVIDWSWNLLDDEQRAALRRLCRLPGGFTRETARAVAGWGDVTDVEAALDGLVNQSMLGIVEEAEPIGLRYHMLETVREFGEEQLSDDESAEVEARQADWACDHAVELVRLMSGSDQLRAVRLLESEHDNLVAALRSAMHRGDRRTAVTVFPVLALFWSVRGAHSEVYTWSPRMIALADDPGDFGDADPHMIVLSYLMAMIHLLFGGVSRALATARMLLRRSVRRGVELDASVRFLAEVALADASGRGFGRLLAEGATSDDLTVRCLAYTVRANALENAGQRRQAWRDATRVLDLARRRGDQWSEAMAAATLGGLSSQAAKYEQAVEYYRLAARIHQHLHSYEEGAQVLAMMGAAYIGSGRIAAGRREARVALGRRGPLMIGGRANDQASEEAETSATATLAEADIAEGKTAEGLAMFRKAVHLSGIENGAPFLQPYASLMASAAVCAHVDGGDRAGAGTLLKPLVEATVPRFLEGRFGRQFVDLPVTGALAIAVACVDVAAGKPADQAAWLLALGARAGARQDFPSLQLERRLEAARAAYGAEIVAEMLRRTDALSRGELVSVLPEALVRRYRAGV